MADISNINLPNGENYDIKDKAARNDIAINRTTLGTQCKNLLKNTATTTTVNNVTFTVNSDGSITAKQTTAAPGNATITVATITLKPGTYILTGDDEIKKSGFGEIRFYVGSTVYSANTAHTFDTEVTITVRIFIWSGVNINGSKTIYPMLRYADITDSTYEPYKESVDERITENTSDIAVSKSTLGYQCKNLLKPTNSITRAGITYTVNSDGSVTLTGTSTSGSSYNYFSIPITLQAGKYKVSGMPETSKTNTYRVDLRANASGGTAYGYGAKEFEVEFTETTTAYYMIRIDGSYKESLNGVTFYPMVRYADITDDSYEPYSDNVDTRLTENKSNIAINKSTLGYQCKNLLKNTAVTKTVSGITFTVNDDKSVTADGTNSTSNYVNIIVFKDELEAGTYILSGAVSDVFRIRLGVGASADGYGTWAGVDTGNGYKFTVTKKALYTVTCQVESGKTASNVIFKPMLRYADIIDSTFEPYKPSLQEQLTALEARIAALGG